MKFPRRLFPVCAALAVAALPTAARPPVPVAHPAPGQRLQFDPRKFMRVSDLRPGMRGYALTVFQGTKIQRFGIKVLGVIKKYNEGKDYILFRATDGPPVTEHLNIAHGMSGSPIYIDGKLVGAISMEVSNGTQGPSFPRDPIGLATPIEEMFDAWSPDLPAKPNSMSAGPLTAGSGGDAATAFSPISMPVSVSGVTPDGIARLGSALAPYHLTLSAGGGGGGKIATNLIQAGKPLQPGAAVGVSLMQGDMDFTATGTVTYRDGNRVLLFGHPFFNLGPIDAALTTASVVGIYPSYEDSVKLGQPLETVGRIFQDRPFSVGGIVGSLPEMIPMTVSVNDLSIKRQKTFHVRIINHPLLTGQFVPMVAQQAIEQVHGLPGDSMATVSMDADVEEIGHVRRTNTFYDGVNIDQAASADIASLVQTLQSNPFYPLALKSVQMSVTIRSGHDTAEIDHIFLRQSKFHPGDDVPIGVVLKPYKRAMATEYLHVHIPANTPDGSLSLNVSGGAEGGGGSISLGGLILLTSSAPSEPAATISQLVKQFVEKPRNNALVADLTLPTSAVIINGDKLTDLPPTLEGVIRSTHSTGIQTLRDEVKVTQEMPYIVSGSQSLTITVQKQDELAEPNPESDHAPSAPPDSGPPPPADSSGGPVMALPATHPMTLLSEPLPASLQSVDASIPPALDGPLAPPSHGPPGGPPPSEAAPASAGSPAPIKAVGRLPMVWRQDTMGEFADGTLQNVSVSSAGDVRLAAGLRKLADTPETYVWAIQPDGHGMLDIATGDRGIIDQMTPDGKLTPFFKTGQLEVTCLALGSDGTLYAGTAPNGIVYQIPPDGKGSKFYTTQEKYVTAFAVSSTQELYIATGGGTGRVYRVPLSTGGAVSPAPLFTSPEAHILSLTVDKNGTVFAGSSPDGIIYKITPDGRHQILYAAPEPNIAALAVDTEGNVYAGTTPQGSVYRISPDGTAKRVLNDAAGGVLSLRTDSADNVYACAGNTIYRIAPDATVQSYAADSDEQFLSLGVSDAAVYAGTGTVGAVYALGGDTAALQGQFESEVHDALLPARWGTLSWLADTPSGTQITLQTRSGDVPAPDSSWSAWSPSYTQPSGQMIVSPPGRYLQYRALLTRDAGAAPDAAPRLRSVAAYYLTRNRPPTVTLVSPAEGTAMRKAALLQWEAGDPDGDTLTYDLSYSADGGKTWTPIKKRALPSGPGAIPVGPTATTAQKPAAASLSEKEIDAQVAAAVAAMDRKYPNLPPSVRNKIASQAGAAIRSSLEAPSANSPEGADGASGTGASGVKDTSFSWDTTEVPDGMYQIQVVASDKPSNPVGWLTATAVSEPFLIANTPPTLTLGAATIHPDHTVTVHGVAQTKLAFVQAVQGHADTGDDVAALADSGLFDSTLEPFTLTVGPLTPGAHVVTVEALDVAGNMTQGTLTITLPGGAASAPPTSPSVITSTSKDNHEPPGPPHDGMAWLYDSAIKQWVQVTSSLLPGSLPPLPIKPASKGHVWLYDTQISQWVEGV